MPHRAPFRALRFGDFLLDVSAYELRRKGNVVRLERQPMELLLLLVDRRDQLLSRDEIVERLWGRDVFIDADTSVNTVIRKVRRALDDPPERSRFVQTVRGKGYRFVADVELATPTVLAVLPFARLQPAADDDYLAAGLTEETIAGLGQLDPARLRVIGHLSSMALQGTTKSLRDVAHELGADYLLDGSIRTADGRCRITCKLIRAHDQAQVWSRTYEREASDLLGLQAELGAAITREIEQRLALPGTTTIARTQTRSPAAYELYLRGRYHYGQMTPATSERALDCFRRATEADPGYALAWAGIAQTYSSRVFNSDTSPSDVTDHARAAAAHALKAGATVAEAHVSAGTVRFLFDWDWRAAETALRRAVALDANSAHAYWMLGHALSQQERHDEALAAARCAREIDPLSALSHAMSAQIAFSARQAEAAARHAQDALHAEPDFWVGFYQIGQAHQQMGLVDRALEALAEASRLSDGNSKPVSLAAYVLASNGRIDEARDRLEQLERLSRSRYVPPYALALVHAGLDDERRALEWLDRSLAVRDPHLVYVLVDPKWDAFRGDARFQEFLRRCGFIT